MAGKYECERIEALMRDGQVEKAFTAAMIVVTRDRGDPTGRVFSIIEQSAEKLPEAALAAAMTYKMFNRPEVRPGAISTFFEMAIAGDNDTIRNLSTLGYGRHLLASEDTARRGVRLIRMARKSGLADASAELGEILENGLYGEKIDLDECLKCYVEATEGGSGTGMFQLAQFMLSHTKAVGEYHPLTLMHEAAKLEHPQAMQFVKHLSKFVDSIEEGEVRDDILPYVVVPDGVERVTLVRDALKNEFDIGVEEAGRMTASLHGYPEWEMMIAAATVEGCVKGKFDEECTAAEFNDREKLQIEIFSARTATKADVAGASIRLLRPTSRFIKPSLRRLDKVVDGHIFKGMPKDLGDMLGKVLEGMGMPAGVNAEDALRTVWPLKPQAWMDMFQDNGWNLRRRRTVNVEDGDQICVTETTDGRLFKVFLSVVSFDPGDLGDEKVEKTMKEIAATCDKAVLIFNHPRLNLVRGSKSRAAFYGGRVLNNGEWWDFMLRKSDGVDDALRQRGLFAGGLPQSVITEYAFEGAVEVACRISAEVTNQESIEGFGLLGGLSHWCSPVPPAAMEAARLMKKVGSMLDQS